MAAIHAAVSELSEFGIDVLSPADPRVVAQIGEFIFVASDKVRSIKMVEDRHLECLQASDFVWLVAPDGYVGQSASMEIGYAIAHDVPVFCQDLVSDGTLRQYVQQVPSISAALPLAFAAGRKVSNHKSFLVDPTEAIEIARGRLDALQGQLARPADRIDDAEGQAILEQKRDLAELFVPAGAQSRRRRTAGV